LSAHYEPDSRESPPIQRYIEDLTSENPRQRSFAVQELGKLRAPQAVSALVALLQKDVNTYVRSASAEALGHIGDAQAVFPLMDALHDSCSFVRRSAAISLGQLKAKEAQGALLYALKDPNFYVRRAAINAIGKLDVPDMGQVLLPLLDAPDPRIRRTVVTALRRLAAQEAIPKMVETLETYIVTPSPRDLPVVKTLVVAFGEMRAAEAVPALIRVVRGYVGGRSLAALALGQIGDKAASEVLVEALNDKSVKLQLAAMKSLGQLGNSEVLPIVRKSLSAPDPRMRRMAVLTVGHLLDYSSAPLLIKIAHDDGSPLVRPAAVEALGKVGNARMVSDLLPLVNDTNAFLRAALAHTLADLDGNTPQTQAALEKLAHDQVEHVALAARSAMARREAPVHPGQDPVQQNDAVKKPASWLKRLLGRV